ncbi:MAG: hypothetical protein ABGW87_08965 [Sphingomonadaceae bacterium]
MHVDGVGALLALSFVSVLDKIGVTKSGQLDVLYSFNKRLGDGTVDTETKVALEKQVDGLTLTQSAFTTNATIADIDKAQSDELAVNAKTNCPISKLLDYEITFATELTAE